MSVEEGSASNSDPARRRRIPLLVAAWTQLGIAILLFQVGGANVVLPVDLPGFLLLVALLLLICSAVAVLWRRPESWWIALLVQLPLLTSEVGLALYIVHALQTYQPQSDWHGIEPILNTLSLTLALLLGFCSLTVLLYLLRPLTREDYGLPASFREPLPLSARARRKVLLGVVCLGLLGLPVRRLVLSYQLSEAVGHRRLATVKRLLREGADVDFRSSQNGSTLLMDAATSGMDEITQALLQAGANVNVHDAWGGTPLMAAVAAQSEGIARALLEAGADVNARDQWGLTALSSAVENGDTRMVKLLLARGANPNTQREGGGTPLMSAYASGKGELVKLLLAHGALPRSIPGTELRR